MINSSSADNDSERDSENLVPDETFRQQETLSVEVNDFSPLTEESSPSQAVASESDHDHENIEESELKIALPEPDADNITVLTHKLPNKPILPWNRYDSPWQEAENEEKTDKNQANSPLSSSTANKQQESPHF